MVQQSVSSVRTKRVFSEEFKVDAVRLVTGEGYSIAAARIRHRRLLNASRNEGFDATVSPRALTNCEPDFGSFAQPGTSPHCNGSASRMPSDFNRTANACCIGPKLYRGDQSGSRKRSNAD